jgi:hypothetical protein
MALTTGATEIRRAFTAQQIPVVVDAYMGGLRAVFAIAAGAYGIATVLGFFGSWRRLRGKDVKNAAGAAA